MKNTLSIQFFSDQRRPAVVRSCRSGQLDVVIRL